MHAAAVIVTIEADARSIRLQPVDSSGELSGDPEQHDPDSFAARVRSLESEPGPPLRWVWDDTALRYPMLLDRGVRVDRCVDLRLTHVILRASERASSTAFALAPPSAWDAPRSSAIADPPRAVSRPPQHDALFDLDEPSFSRTTPPRSRPAAPGEPLDVGAGADARASTVPPGSLDPASAAGTTPGTAPPASAVSRARESVAPGAPASRAPATAPASAAPPASATPGVPASRAPASSRASAPGVAGPASASGALPAVPTLGATAPASVAPHPLDPLVEHRAQLAALAAVAQTAPQDAARLRLLLAAESAGALAAAEMRHVGIPWRTDRHDALLTAALGPRPTVPGARPARLEELLVAIRTALGDPAANPDSPVELVKSLQRAGLRVSSTRQWELERLEHPVVEPLLAYKKLSRLLTANGWTWLDTWVAGGRFHPVYLPGGVVTGRWASEGGGALQLPHQVRSAVVADDGWRLVVADASQLEPRILAALSGDRAMAEAGWGRDLYDGIVASGAVDTRAHAKVGMLGAMYGATQGDGGRMLPRLARAFPSAVSFVETAARAGERGDRVTTRLGRTSPRPSDEWLDQQDAAREPGAAASLQTRARGEARSWGRFTRNFVVQGTAAEWALCWLAELRRRLWALPAPPTPPPVSVPAASAPPRDPASAGSAPPREPTSAASVPCGPVPSASAAPPASVPRSAPPAFPPAASAPPASSAPPRDPATSAKAHPHPHPQPLERRPHLAFFLHDEVMIHTPAEFADAVAAEVREAAAAAGRILFPGVAVDFPVTVATVDSYDHAK